MKRNFWLLPVLALAACGGSQTEQPQDSFFTADEWLKVRGHSPLPDLPPSPTNKFADNAKAAKLGQKLFFDARFSGPLVSAENEKPGSGGSGKVGDRGKLACASCHQPDRAFIDARSNPGDTSLGAGRTGRQAPTLVNVAYMDYFFWDARADSLWMQAMRPVMSHNEMNFSMLEIAHAVYNFHKTDYEDIFGVMPNLGDLARFPAEGGPAPPEGSPPATASWLSMTSADQDAVRRIVVNFSKAIEAYERKLVSGNSKFDKYVSGNHSLFSTREKNGLKLFIGTARCELCHKNPTFSDGIFHNLALKRGNGPNIAEHDYGAETAYQYTKADIFNGIGPYSDDTAAGKQKLDFLVQPPRGTFRTSPLRNISQTAPYFHDGSRATLKEVMILYRNGGDPAGTFDGSLDPQMANLQDRLTDSDLDDLVEFMKTLDGEAIDPSLLQPPAP